MILRRDENIKLVKKIVSDHTICWYFRDVPAQNNQVHKGMKGKILAIKKK